MSCLNCNKDTVGTAVFCDECLQAMEAYPVEKGTPAIIPVQPSPISQKKQTHELFGSLEENLSITRRAARRLAGALAIMSLLLLLLSITLIYICVYGVPDFVHTVRFPW
ncbi:MAG: hypothetical protein E7435_02125 [Ruminococcaceae bacterium]|nr:hypothetical protein [Oscillospiraceae bacterium]